MKLSKNNIKNYRIITLSNERNFVNINRTHYGGRQRWFENPNYRKRGCGTIAASNITIHMARYVKGCSNLYLYNDLSLDNFKNHMNEILLFIRPTIIGIPTLRYFSKGLERFAKSKDVNLKAYFLRRNSSIESLSNYIKNGLKQNSPIAYLQYYNPKLPKLNWHWITITGYIEDLHSDNRYIIVSTWGRRQVYNLDILYKSNIGGGFVHFRPF